MHKSWNSLLWFLFLKVAAMYLIRVWIRASLKKQYPDGITLPVIK